MLQRISLLLLLLLPCWPALAKAGELNYAEGLQLLQQGYYQEAVLQLERAVQASPEADRCFALGVAYFKLHRLPQAYRAYQQALGLLPPPALSARVRSGLGDVYFEMEAYTEASEAYRRALAFDPRWNGVRLKLATSYLRLGHFDDALAESENLLQNQSALNEALYLQGLIFLARHQWPEALDALQKLAQQPERRFEAYQQLNWLYRLQQNFPAARAIAEKAVQEFGRQIPQAYQLAAVSGLEELTQCLPLSQCDADLVQLRDYFDRWLLLNPDQPQASFALGWFEQLQGHLPEAQAAYQRAYELFPAHTEYLLKQSESSWALGERRQALVWLSTIPQQRLPWQELPKWANAAPELFHKWIQERLPGQQPEALRPFWIHYLEAMPNLTEASAEYQVLQALRLWQAGQPAWARPLLLQAHQQSPRWWLPCELMGRLLLEQQGPEALKWLTAAYRLNPLSQDLALLLAQTLPAGELRQQHLQHALISFPDDRRLQAMYLGN